MEGKRPHVALLVSPGLGHLIPFLELGKRFVTCHGFDATAFVVATDHSSPAESQFLKLAESSKLLNIVLLPPVDIAGLVDPAASIMTVLVVMMRESFQKLRSAIIAMPFCPTVLIVDLFGTEAVAIADEFAMQKYVYITSNAWFLAQTLHVPNLGEVVEGEPVQIPGCKPVQFEDVFEPILDRENRVYDEYVSMGVDIIRLADGILVNTWEDLEPTSLGALRGDQIFGDVAKVPVYPIGPLVRPVGSQVMKSDILEWLDMQPTESVIYVSFGSGGTLSTQQTVELAWGLELSQQRFIWVLRAPIEDDASGALFNIGNGHDALFGYLPDGFLTRTHDVGLVIPMWAPQAEILGHQSIGGFLSHCGWNSTLESIVNGVPMMAWPLYAEQKMNAAMLTDEVGVAVRPKILPSSQGLVGREEIERMVKKIMVEKKGREIRERAKELKCSAEKALSKGGSSCNSLFQVAKKCEMSKQCDKGKFLSGRA